MELKEAMKKLKVLLEKFAEAEPPASDEPAKPMEAELKDGTKITLEPGLEKDAKVTGVEDGSYEVKTEKGIVAIKVEGGKISELSEPVAEEPKAEDKKDDGAVMAALSEMKTSLAAVVEENKVLKAELEKVKGKISESANLQKETFSIVEKLAALPDGKNTEDSEKKFKKGDAITELAKGLQAVRKQIN